MFIAALLASLAMPCAWSPHSRGVVSPLKSIPEQFPGGRTVNSARTRGHECLSASCTDCIALFPSLAHQDGAGTMCPGSPSIHGTRNWHGCQCASWLLEALGIQARK